MTISIKPTASGSTIEQDGSTILTIDASDNVTVANDLTATSFIGNGSSLTGLPAGYTDADALSLFNASGSTPVYACRAWVNFNGTGTVAIRASGNVSSITDRGTGRYSVNFATAMPDANYSIVNTGSNNPGNTNYGHAAMIDGEAGTPLTTTYTYIAYKSDTASYVDVVYGCVAIFR